METIQITKDKTAIIKGIAILFMIANHCLLEKYYLNPSPFLSTALGRELCVFTKICVPIFTFIVGYGFFYSYKNFCAYLKRHGGTLLKYYWFYLFILAIPLVAFTGEYSVDAKNVALNMIGLEHEYCLGNWYVYFYIYCLLILPLFKYIFHKEYIVKTLIVVLLCGVLSYVTNSNNIYLQAFSTCMFYTPILVMGYVCAKTQILSLLGRVITRKSLWFALLLFACLIRILFGDWHWGISTDTVIVPIFIISICGLITGKENQYLSRIFTSIGNNSTLMWFIHCLFFSKATKSFFQSSEMWPSNIIVVFVIVTVVSYIGSVVFNTIFKKLDSCNVGRN